MAYACDMSSKCVTDSLDRGKTPYEMWPPAFDTLLPFGTVDCRRVEKPSNKMVSRGTKSILLGTAGPHDVHDHRPRGTVRVRDLTTGGIIWRQAVTLHPAARAGGGIPLSTTTRRGDKGRLEPFAATSGTGSQEDAGSGTSAGGASGVGGVTANARVHHPGAGTAERATEASGVSGDARRC